MGDGGARGLGCPAEDDAGARDESEAHCETKRIGCSSQRQEWRDSMRVVVAVIIVIVVVVVDVEFESV